MPNTPPRVHTAIYKAKVGGIYIQLLVTQLTDT